jgi:carbonic anhydrase
MAGVRCDSEEVIPRLATAAAHLLPARLSCMDTRIDLLPMLGLARGDAHIIRNAGGLVTDDAIRR